MKGTIQNEDNGEILPFMNTTTHKIRFSEGYYDRVLTALYGEAQLAFQRERWLAAIRAFEAAYGEDDVMLFSVPGRSEISGNHTDHNGGRVLAAAVDLDIIAIAARSADPCIRVTSEHFGTDCVQISSLTPQAYPRYSSASIIAGMCDAFRRHGLAIGGLNAYTTSRVLCGSGLSSSAAFEVMIGCILNHLYADCTVTAPVLAQMAQYAENEFFGKPCGLMDQTACAVGGLITIDFADAPLIEQLPFDLRAQGYALCIVNTGGSHADLHEDYAAVPSEMKAVAAALGHSVLRPLTAQQIIDAAPALRKSCGDRAILRALHFTAENARVSAQADALRRRDFDAFLNLVCASGSSSFRFLQNVYSPQHPTEQGLSLALAISENLMASWSERAASRVHGGGFAGTIQAFVPLARVPQYTAVLDGVFGQGAVTVLSVRQAGAVSLDEI